MYFWGIGSKKHAPLTPDTMKEELEALEALETIQPLTTKETERLEELYFILGE